MDIYDEMIEFFSVMPEVDSWEVVRTLFRQVGSSKPYHWKLPFLACEAVGGTPEQALPAAIALACSYISIILVDDMLDADPRGAYHRLGMPAIGNIACAFQAAGLLAIGSSQVETAAKVLLADNLNHMLLTTALGQYWDTLCPEDEEGYWKIVRTKSSPFFGSALYAGALAGGGNAVVAERCLELGHLYGEMIQIHDDLNDALEIPASPDWSLRRANLPILFAQLVDHPDRQRFTQLRRGTLDLDELAEAQTILIRCGAISYGIDQLVRRYEKCRRLLESLSFYAPQGMVEMLDGVIQPVEKLFAALGGPQFSYPLGSAVTTA